MKRTKLLLSAFVSILLAFVLVFAVACGGDKGPAPNVRPAPQAPEKPAGDLGITDSSEEKLALQYIRLQSPGKTEFDLGEQFDGSGISVRAVFLNPDKQATLENIEGNLEYKELTKDEFVVDSSDYNPDKVGTYTIYVSYTFGGVTRYVTYKVSVKVIIPAIGGIVAELADGKDDTYSLSASSTSVKISKDILAVYAMEADENGKVVKSAEPLDADKYDAQLYLGSKEIPDNEATENGTYSFVATLKEDESKQDFIPVYVVNSVTKIELDLTAGSKFEQTKSMKDEMSSTWQFTVTYANGVKKTVKAGDARLTIELDTNTVGSRMATVTYVEAGQTVTCEVPYTIKEKQQSGSTNYALTYDVDGANWVATWANGVEDTDGTVKVDVSALTTAKEGSKTTEDGSVSVTDSYEFKSGKELRVTIGDSATNVTIKYYVSHGTKGDSTRTATVTLNGTEVASVTPQATEEASPNLYIMTVENAAAGTYVLSANNTMRVYMVEISYTVGSGNQGGGQTIDPIHYRPEVGSGSMAAGETLVLNDVLKVYLSANSEVPSYVVESSGKEVYDANAEGNKGEKLPVRLKFGGGIAKAKDEIAVKNAIVIETSSACTVTFYVRSSSGSAARLFQPYTFDAATGELTPVFSGLDNNVNPNANLDLVYPVTFELEAGTYYFGSASAGVGIYGFDVAFPEGGNQGGNQDGSQEATDPVNFRPEVGSGSMAAGETLVLNDVLKVYLSANGEVPSYVVESSGKEVYDANAEGNKGEKLPVRLKFGGGIAKAKDEIAVKNAIVIETSSACTVTFYVRSSSGSAARLFQPYTFDAATGELTPVFSGLDNNVNPNANLDLVYPVTFELEAGTYYFGSASAGVGIYGFDIIFS